MYALLHVCCVVSCLVHSLVVCALGCLRGRCGARICFFKRPIVGPSVVEMSRCMRCVLSASCVLCNLLHARMCVGSMLACRDVDGCASVACVLAQQKFLIDIVHLHACLAERTCFVTVGMVMGVVAGVAVGMVMGVAFGVAVDIEVCRDGRLGKSG